MRKIIAFLILISILFTACSSQGHENITIEDQDKENQAKRPDAEIAIEKCIRLCLDKEENLSKGPCLSEEIIEGWVCDVAHDPREDIDDKPENRCKAYGDTAEHFVEIDPKCRFIRFR